MARHAYFVCDEWCSGAIALRSLLFLLLCFCLTVHSASHPLPSHRHANAARTRMRSTAIRANPAPPVSPTSAPPHCASSADGTSLSVLQMATHC